MERECVSWFSGEAPLPSQTYSSSNFIWPTPPPGAHVIRARVTDNDGATTWSASMRVTVLDQTSIAGPRVVALSTPDPIAIRGTDDFAVIEASRSGDPAYHLVIQHEVNGLRHPDFGFETVRPRIHFNPGQVVAPMVIRALTSTNAPQVQSLEFRLASPPPGHAGFYHPSGEETSPAATVHLLQPPGDLHPTHGHTLEPVLFTIETKPPDGIILNVFSNPGTSALVERSTNGQDWSPFHRLNSSPGSLTLPVPIGPNEGSSLFRVATFQGNTDHQ